MLLLANLALLSVNSTASSFIFWRVLRSAFWASLRIRLIYLLWRFYCPWVNNYWAFFCGLVFNGSCKYWFKNFSVFDIFRLGWLIFTLVVGIWSPGSWLKLKNLLTIGTYATGAFFELLEFSFGFTDGSFCEIKVELTSKDLLLELWAGVLMLDNLRWEICCSLTIPVGVRQSLSFIETFFIESSLSLITCFLFTIS